MRALRVGLVCVFSAACGSSTGPIADRLVVTAAPPQLQLTNESPAPVYVFAIESGLAMRANWGPCTDPATCRGIPAGATDELAYSGIAGYTESATHAIVYWWHLVPRDGGGYAPDSIRAVGVEL